MHQSILTMCVVVLLSGCANPINRYTAARYYQMGGEAESRGNFEEAREAYRRAMLNADWGNLGISAKAYTLYEFARVSGYLCIHDETEKAFKESLELQEKDQSLRAQLRPPTLLELARFYYDTDRKREALPYYEEGVELVRKLKVDETDPVRFATVLEEYAEALRADNQTQKADGISKEAKRLREVHPERNSDIPFERYNTRCSK